MTAGAGGAVDSNRRRPYHRSRPTVIYFKPFNKGAQPGFLSA